MYIHHSKKPAHILGVLAHCFVVYVCVVLCVVVRRVASYGLYCADSGFCGCAEVLWPWKPLQQAGVKFGITLLAEIILARLRRRVWIRRNIDFCSNH